MFKKSTFLITLTLVLSIVCKKPICYSKSSAESEAIFSYLNEDRSGFYIDINPQNQLMNSSTAFLRSQGWTGVNIFPSHAKHFKYGMVANGDANIVVEESILTNSSNLNQDSKLALNISSICMNLSKEMADLVVLHVKYLDTFLTVNDLKDNKCKPKIIIVRLYGETEGVPKVLNDKLQTMGYVQKIQSLGKFVVYVDDQKCQELDERLLKNLALLGKSPLTPLSSVLSQLSHFALQKTEVQIGDLSDSIIDDDLLVVLSKCHTTLYPNNSRMKNQLVLQFDPNTTNFVIDAQRYEVEMRKSQNYNIYHLKYFSNFIYEYHIFILDQQFVPFLASNIKVTALKKLQQVKYAETSNSAINAGVLAVSIILSVVGSVLITGIITVYVVKKRYQSGNRLKSMNNEEQSEENTQDNHSEHISK